MSQEIIRVEEMVDPHVHLREGDDIMTDLIKYSIEGGAGILGPMPNTTAGLHTAKDVLGYIDNACSLIRGTLIRFIPIMMISELTTEEEIAEAVTAGIIDGKIYPYLRTTKSERGVSRYGNILKQVIWAGKHGMKIHVHPEHPSLVYPNRDAEYMFTALERQMLEESNDVIIISEHGTDARCIPHWKDLATSGRFFVTLTAHHLAANEDNTFGDVRAICKPPLKTESDRQGLVGFVAEDHSWVMAGTDSAPHDFSPMGAKHVHQGRCACGAFTAPFALLLYAHALDPMLQLDTGPGRDIFVNFTSRNARKLHGLPSASRSIDLVRKPWNIPGSYPVGPWRVEPFWAGETLKFSMAR